MQQVAGTVPLVRVNLGKIGLRHGQAGDHVRPDGHELTQDSFDVCAARTSAVGAVFIRHEYSLLVHAGFSGKRPIAASRLIVRPRESDRDDPCGRDCS
jgi:hypothetical protein